MYSSLKSLISLVSFQVLKPSGIESWSNVFISDVLLLDVIDLVCPLPMMESSRAESCSDVFVSDVSFPRFVDLVRLLPVMLRGETYYL